MAPGFHWSLVWGCPAYAPSLSSLPFGPSGLSFSSFQQVLSTPGPGMDGSLPWTLHPLGTSHFSSYLHHPSLGTMCLIEGDPPQLMSAWILGFSFIACISLTYMYIHTCGCEFFNACFYVSTAREQASCLAFHLVPGIVPGTLQVPDKYLSEEWMGEPVEASGAAQPSAG